MSSCDRRSLLALLGVLPLAACGFTPVYGPGGPGLEIRDRLSLATPETRLEFELVSQLEDRLGRVATAPYALSYEIETSTSDLAISDTEDINRVNIYGTVSYSVTDTATGVQVQTGEVSTFTAYATSASPVSTSAAERDAETRLMIALADQIVSRLISGAGAWS
ncbi:hypothetical protein roselon_00854 [Roseibacterium elongatum DSM 19469]|uniref:Lipoprotein n=1 Tax=Roseicyclus elongatus DSM 19469 TaxID=1294273 RepID=W8RQ12_9RHOB|nr:LPS assembly lipoprotein LptE [Roseibacterium elongatum]AHM03264.1 hypothetical protein roselon_00854 [Roseibacterium elongatum DSM 19469]